MDQAKLFLQQTIMPLRNYVGRKGGSGILQTILSEVPKCSLFIDAMCGSGIVGSQLQNCQVIFNDRDKRVIEQIRVNSEYALFLNESYQDIIKRYDNGNSQRIFYFDPPYVMETRKQQIKMFNYDWSDKDHSDFLGIILKIKCPTLVTQYPNSMYDRALRKWRKVSYTAMTRGGKRIENLYMNFPQPVLLQCFEHVGKDYIDRQRLKRKIDAMLKRFDRYDPKERAAVLSSIIEHYNYVGPK